MPIVCPNCGRTLARRYSNYLIIAYRGRRYCVTDMQEIVCSCKAKVSLPVDRPPAG